MTEETRYACGVAQTVEALAEELDNLIEVEQSDQASYQYVLVKLEGMVQEMKEAVVHNHIAIEAAKHLGDMSDEHERLHAQEHHLQAEAMHIQAKVLDRFITYVKSTLKQKA